MKPIHINMSLEKKKEEIDNKISILEKDDEEDDDDGMWWNRAYYASWNPLLSYFALFLTFVFH